ncbi:glycosyltransferase family protein [Acaryochloris marina]|uniref:glycosyltransferase family 4 protein n=1 Tax=Acaryochloris marina TaxID=155978 RepID=UPI0011D110A6|nr:glycosyltransferase family 4 protein [Acaryochloris marina]BDM79496.1 hypothetical protein AM10699_23640 [Acaryochloris marina MBIC10699]
MGGNPQGLSKALNKLGIDSKSLALTQNYFNYKPDYVLWSKTDGLILREIKRLILLIKVLFLYDIIHYNFGTTIAYPTWVIKAHKNYIKAIIRFFYRQYCWNLQLIELNIYSLLNKKIFITYQGNDARQGDFCLKNFEFNIASQVDDEFYNPESDALKRIMIQRMSKYCREVYALNPDLMHVLPKKTKFIPYSHVFLDEWTPHYNQLENRKLRIGHAPSNRKVKGTDIILNSLACLEKEGYEFELILVEGVSNSEAKKLYASVDVLIDQIFAGWYGGLAVEAMALGKPVLVYIRELDLKFVPTEMVNDFPFIQVNPNNIESKLRMILELPRKDLLALAKKSRAFVEKWHNPLDIASKIKEDYIT